MQTDDRVRQLLGGVDADVIVCGHTHSVLQRRVRRADGGETLIVSPGTVSYGRGREKEAGRADYALLDWGQRTGWQVTLRAVRYETRPMYEALVALEDEFPARGEHGEPGAPTRRRGDSRADARFHPVAMGGCAAVVG